ncbi:MAG TPA: T9SS type A sorting domain-containing protein [Flavisolibacter sp.]|nr:T9SS type A sorting domain-containing protein [Flavisolibacter sp.]
MRRIFTYSFALACAFFTTAYSFGQCGSGTFTSGQTNTFDSNEEGFSGNFTWNNGGGGQLSSSNVAAGTTKVLITSTYFLPANSNLIAWGFDLTGNANVTSYTVEAIYDGAGSTVLLCSGGVIANGSDKNFNAPAPAQIKGASFKLKITFTVSGSNPQIKTIDNFRTNATASQITLPVRFSSFNAKSSAGSVVLSWNVEAEENLSGYEIERSHDGRSFSKIGFVGASSQKSYSYTDSRPLTSGYYRIKSVDVDGKFMYSIVVSLKGSVLLKAFMSNPNTLTVQHDAAQSGSRISINSADGRLIKSLAPVSGMQQTTVDLSSAKAGLYLVQFDNGSGEATTLKVVKQQ